MVAGWTVFVVGSSTVRKIKLVDYASYISLETGCKELAASPCFQLPQGSSLWIPYGKLVVPIWYSAGKEADGTAIMLPIFSKALNKAVKQEERERFQEIVQDELKTISSPVAAMYEKFMADTDIAVNG